jgi:hypothetical protein
MSDGVSVHGSEIPSRKQSDLKNAIGLGMEIGRQEG